MVREDDMRLTYTEMLEAMDDIQADCERLKIELAEVWDGIKEGCDNKVLYCANDIANIAYALQIEALDLRFAAEALEFKAKEVTDGKQ